MLSGPAFFASVTLRVVASRTGRFVVLAVLALGALSFVTAWFGKGSLPDWLVATCGVTALAVFAAIFPFTMIAGLYTKRPPALALAIRWRWRATFSAAGSCIFGLLLILPSRHPGQWWFPLAGLGLLAYGLIWGLIAVWAFRSRDIA